MPVHPHKIYNSEISIYNPFPPFEFPKSMHALAPFSTWLFNTLKRFCENYPFVRYFKQGSTRTTTLERKTKESMVFNPPLQENKHFDQFTPHSHSTLCLNTTEPPDDKSVQFRLYPVSEQARVLVRIFRRNAHLLVAHEARGGRRVPILVRQ